MRRARSERQRFGLSRAESIVRDRRGPRRTVRHAGGCPAGHGGADREPEPRADPVTARATDTQPSTDRGPDYETDGQTDGQTDGETNRRSDGEAHRPADRQANGDANTQAGRHCRRGP
jgi:hypothetical protein